MKSIWIIQEKKHYLFLLLILKDHENQAKKDLTRFFKIMLYEIYEGNILAQKNFWPMTVYHNHLTFLSISLNVL